MTSLLLHVGYPKTATTTLQNGLFYKLHKRGKINFFGKAIYADDKSISHKGTDYLIKSFLTLQRKFGGRQKSHSMIH